MLHEKDLYFLLRFLELNSVSSLSFKDISDVSSIYGLNISEKDIKLLFNLFAHTHGYHGIDETTFIQYSEKSIGKYSHFELTSHGYFKVWELEREYPDLLSNFKNKSM